MLVAFFQLTKRATSWGPNNPAVRNPKRRLRRESEEAEPRGLTAALRQRNRGPRLTDGPTGRLAFTNTVRPGEPCDQLRVMVILASCLWTKVLRGWALSKRLGPRLDSSR